MNNQDPQLNKLYRDGADTEPPKSVDDVILRQAAQAHHKSQYSRLRPWMVAASLLLVVPFLWLFLQQPEMQQSRQESLQPEPVPQADTMEESPHPIAPSLDDMDTQTQTEERDRITITGSRIKRTKSPSDKADRAKPTNNRQSTLTSDSEAKKDAGLLERKQESTQYADSTFEEVRPPASEALPSDYLGAQKTPKTFHLLDRIEHLKPDKLTSENRALWQKLEQQLNKQEWPQSRQTLQKLITTHSEIDFSDFSRLLDAISEEN